jgi:hypothetical protein
MIQKRNFSPNIMAALGYMPSDPPERIMQEDRNLVWQLVGVKDIVALKNS